MPNPMAASNLFDTLPIETCQQIASHLESPQDICSYARVCHSTHDAIEGDHFSFWRRLFLETYEKPSWKGGSNEDYKKAYQKRRISLLHGANFEKDPSSAKAVCCLEVLRDLIVDSFSELKPTDDPAMYTSKNMEWIHFFTTNQDLLRNVLMPPRGRSSRRGGEVYTAESRLLKPIQIVLAPKLFCLDFEQDHFRFPESQQCVYSTAATWPIFTGCNGLDVNMEWLLHQLNFWKYHMLREAECSLHTPYSELEEHERPRFWNEQLRQGYNKLGKHWKGSYAYVDRSVINSIRNGGGEDSSIPDDFGGDLDAGSFQDMRFDFVDDEDGATWPREFEQILHSLMIPVNKAKTRAQHRSSTPEGLGGFKHLSFQFEGEGHDANEDFFAWGWLNALPPQERIPGWQRMTMMKYFEDPDTGAIDRDALWAYEGVVLPGGQMMIGRWWSPNDGMGGEMYSGPFILWCVDGSKVEEDEDIVEEDGA